MRSSAGRPAATRVGRRRSARIALQLAVSGGILAFLLWQIDVGRTVELIATSDAAYLGAAFVLFLATTWALAWRWQLLLGAKGIREPLGWLTRLYFVGYAAGQVLPTSLGGDAVRIIEHARRRPDARAEAAAAVFMERIVGAVGTLLLVAVGLAVIAGRYEDLALLVWIEVACVAALAVLAVLLFSRRTGRHLRERVFPLGRRLRLERPLTTVHTALHEYRAHTGALVGVLAVTLLAQAARMASVWLCGEAVGVDVSPLVYVALGPLLFLVMMVPFTVNGLGVREAFFVAFLARFGVSADAAFATGFLFYAVTIATSVPGGLIMLWRSVRPALVRARPG